jgi:hypothetical protein
MEEPSSPLPPERKNGGVEEWRKYPLLLPLFHSSTPPFFHSIFIRNDAVRRTGMATIVKKDTRF